MEETIQEALSKGVEMHVAGEFDLAGQLYESVIKLQRNHADANHNMGLLKLDTGNDLEALPYLQTALQADTTIAQFWLSYIKALVKLKRLDEAARILDLAKESGFQGGNFEKLHQSLNSSPNSGNSATKLKVGTKMGKYDYYNEKFPYATDMNVKIGNGATAFVGKHSYGIELIQLRTWGSMNTFSVGRFCSIANCQFFLGGNHPKEYVAQGLFLPKFFSNAEPVEESLEKESISIISNGNIRIGNDVWIGNNSTIMSGIQINDGAVIAANSHVVKDVPPYAIVGGNPAQIIGFRFDDDIIEILLEFKWWELDDLIINKMLPSIRMKPSVAVLNAMIVDCKNLPRTTSPAVEQW